MSDALPPFQLFLDEHREHVWRLLVAAVGRQEADDCFQETFIAALRAYPRLRTGGSRHNLRAWVLTIAHRKALDHHRSRARQGLPSEDIQALAIEQGPPQDTPDGTVWRAVGELPTRQRSAVLLRFAADMTHREIAGVIGCSEEAARRSLHEGLSKLRKAMGT